MLILKLTLKEKPIDIAFEMATPVDDQFKIEQAVQYMMTSGATFALTTDLYLSVYEVDGSWIMPEQGKPESWLKRCDARTMICEVYYPHARQTGSWYGEEHMRMIVDSLWFNQQPESPLRHWAMTERDRRRFIANDLYHMLIHKMSSATLRGKSWA